MKKIITISALLCAAASASEFSYTDVGINYATGSAELPNFVSDFFGIGKDLDVEAVQAEARFQIAEGFYGYLNYDNANIEVEDVGLDFDYWAVTAGMGGHCSLAESLDSYYGAGYRYSSLGIDDYDQSLGYIRLHAGLRWAPVSWLEVNPSLIYDIGVKDDDFLEAINITYVNLNLYLTSFECVRPFVGGSLELQSSDDNLVGDLALFKAGIRFDF